MQLSGIPTKYQLVWGQNAVPADIRVVPFPSQISIQAGAASFNDGFPPLNFEPIQAGGIPPFGADFNGILNSITAWSQWHQAGGPVYYDSSFSSQVNGYPQGAIVQSSVTPGLQFVSLVDNNTNNPDSSGVNWLPITGGTGLTGNIMFRPTNEALAGQGWIQGNATTIGSAGSGASQLAAPQAIYLYSWFWTNFSNTLCPVTGGRGSSAAADFAANKPLQVLDTRGYSMVGMDTMGGGATTRLTGVPVTSGAINAAGSQIGEILHALLTAELAAHTHANSLTDPTHNHPVNNAMPASGVIFQGSGSGGGGTGTVTTTLEPTGVTITNASIGSGTGHNNVPLAYTGTWYFHL